MTIFTGVVLLTISGCIVWFLYDLFIALTRADSDFYNHGEPKPPILFRGIYMAIYENEERKITKNIDESLENIFKEHRDF